MREENRRIFLGRMRLNEIKKLEGFAGGTQAEGDLGEVSSGGSRGVGEEEAVELGAVP